MPQWFTFGPVFVIAGGGVVAFAFLSWCIWEVCRVLRERDEYERRR